MSTEPRNDDQDKDPWHLLPLEPVWYVVRVLSFGAKKYGPNNWQSLPEARERYYAAAMRHLYRWRMGETYDQESGLPHLAHAACCLVFLQWAWSKEIGK